MNVETVAVTGAGTSAVTKVIPSSPFNIGFGVVVSGSATYTIEHTFDGVNFYSHEVLVAKTDNQDGNYAFPVAGIRINLTSGAGTVTLTAIQAG